MNKYSHFGLTANFWAAGNSIKEVISNIKKEGGRRPLSESGVMVWSMEPPSAVEVNPVDGSWAAEVGVTRTIVKDTTKKTNKEPIMNNKTTTTKATKKSTAKKAAPKKVAVKAAPKSTKVEVKIPRPRNLDPTVQNINGDKFYDTDRVLDSIDAVKENEPSSKEFSLGVRRLEGRIFDADYKASVQFRRAACGHHVFSKCKRDDVAAYGTLLVSMFD